MVYLEQFKFLQKMKKSDFDENDKNWRDLTFYENIGIYDSIRIST
jgi:hypothetical protein